MALTDDVSELDDAILTLASLAKAHPKEVQAAGERVWKQVEGRIATAQAEKKRRVRRAAAKLESAEARAARRKELGGNDDATARPAFMAARELRAVMDEPHDTVRRSDRWWEIAVLLLLAYYPDLESKRIGLGAEVPWGDGPQEELFNDRESILIFLLKGFFLPDDRADAKRNLNLLLLRTAKYLSASSDGRQELGASPMDAHIAEIIQAKAIAKKEAEVRARRTKGLLELHGLAWSCTRHKFLSAFEPLREGESHVDWLKRCDWEKFARAWMQDAILPFLRELRAKGPALNIDCDGMLAYLPDHTDERVKRIAFTANLAKRSYTRLDDEDEQAKLAAELVRVSEADTEWRETYLDFFEVVAHHLEEEIAGKPSSAAPPTDERASPKRRRRGRVDPALEPPTPREKAFLDALAERDPGAGLNGTEVIAAMAKHGVHGVTQGNLTSRIVPGLRGRGWGVPNRGTLGYYMTEADRERYSKLYPARSPDAATRSNQQQ